MRVVRVLQARLLTNLHLLEGENARESSLPVSLRDSPLLKLSDTQLSTRGATKLTIGFLPTGAPNFLTGYKLFMAGTVVKTGRLDSPSAYGATVPTREDWLLIRLSDSKQVASLSPIAIAHEDVVQAAEEVILMGFPQQLIARDGQNAYSQKCVGVQDGVYFHACVVTHGQSGSPLMAAVALGGASWLELVAIASSGKFESTSKRTTAVPASSFRAYVEALRADSQCE